MGYPLSRKILHPEVFDYIEKEELYFYSPQAKRKRFLYGIFYMSFSVAVVASVVMVTIRKISKD